MDVYTGQSILEYETEDIIKALNVVCQFIHPSQCISIYSYKGKSPLNNYTHVEYKRYLSEGKASFKDRRLDHPPSCHYLYGSQVYQ